MGNLRQDIAGYLAECLHATIKWMLRLRTLVGLAGLYGLSFLFDWLTPVLAFQLTLLFLLLAAPFLAYRTMRSELVSTQDLLNAVTGRRLVDVDPSYANVESSPTIRITSRIDTKKVKVMLVLDALYEPIRYLQWADGDDEKAFIAGETHDITLGRLSRRVLVVNATPDYTITGVADAESEEDRLAYDLILRISAAGRDHYDQIRVVVSTNWEDESLKSAGVGKITVLSTDLAERLRPS